MNITTRYIHLCLISTLLTLTLAGCTADPSTQLDDDFESQVVIEPGPPVAERTADAAQGAAAADAIAFAQQMSAGPVGTDVAAAAGESGPPQVEWIELSPPSQAWKVAGRRGGATEPPRAAAAMLSATTVTEPDIESPAADAVDDPAAAGPFTFATYDDNSGDAAESGDDLQARFTSLTNAVHASRDAPEVKAFNLAALNAILDQPFDAQSVQELDDDQDEQFDQFHKLLLAVRGNLLSQQAAFDQAALWRYLDELSVGEPIQIRTVKLVREVSGYGVYDSFASHRFIAGRENLIIVYVELDYFKPAQTDEGKYQVRLSQEIELSTYKDGVPVFRQPRQELVDDSHNRRRDFFTHQFIRLPANLSVGKYLLKVRVIDINGDSQDERTVPLVMVTDSRMVADDEK